MRLLRLLTAGAVIGAAVVAIKRLMEQHAEGQDGPAQGTAGASTSPSRESSSARSADDAAGRPTAASSSNGGEPTKAELYERAQELGIEGRSKMSKRELQRAIESSGS